MVPPALCSLSVSFGRCDSLIQLGYFQPKDNTRSTQLHPVCRTVSLHPGRVSVPRGGSSAVAAVRRALSGKHVACEGGSEPHGKRVGAPENCQSVSQSVSHSVRSVCLAVQLYQLPPPGRFDHYCRLISSGETFPRFLARAKPDDIT